jgi:hypothetical protein
LINHRGKKVLSIESADAAAALQEIDKVQGNLFDNRNLS